MGPGDCPCSKMGLERILVSFNLVLAVFGFRKMGPQQLHMVGLPWVQLYVEVARVFVCHSRLAPGMGSHAVKTSDLELAEHLSRGFQRDVLLGLRNFFIFIFKWGVLSRPNLWRLGHTRIQG